MDPREIRVTAMARVRETPGPLSPWQPWTSTGESQERDEAPRTTTDSGQHSNPSDQWNLDRLDDGVLLEVLQHLPVEDLLTCRCVSKRLGGLAMHPSVWRRKAVNPPHGLLLGGGHAEPVLRLAPCLGGLSVVLLDRDCPLLSETRCAVEDLEIDVLASSSAQRAALAVRRQGLLGRLRTLAVELWPEDQLTAADASALCRAVAETAGLQSLVFDMQTDAGPVAMPCAARVVPSSIKSAVLNVRGQDAFVDVVLSTHAATLEAVRFREPVSTSTLQLLAVLPRLRELTCVLQAGLGVLAASESLEVLTIRMEEEVAAEAVVDAAALLRRQARRLRQVAVRCGGRGAHHAEHPAALVRALAAGAPHLETLCVACRCDGQVQLLGRALLDALPGLQALRELHLACWDPYSESPGSSHELLLRGLTPATAPALRSLAVAACAHAWLHHPAVEALLAASPALRVRVGWLDRPGQWCPTEVPDLRPQQATCGRCDACRLDCHRVLQEAGCIAYACLSRKEEPAVCEERLPIHGIVRLYEFMVDCE